MSYLTQLDARSHGIVQGMLKALFGMKSVSFSLPPSPGKDYVEVAGFWLRTGPNPTSIPHNYILTPSIEENLVNVARVVVSHRYGELFEFLTQERMLIVLQHYTIFK